MITKRLCIIQVCFFAFLFNVARAQEYEGNWLGGFSLGASQSKIENLDQTILSEPFFLNYSLDTKPRYGFNFGGYVNYRGPFHNLLAIRLEAIFSQQGSDLNFNNYQTDFNYKIQFKYEYLNLNLIFKIYCADKDNPPDWAFLSRLNGYAGIRAGINLNPSKIIYTSGGSGQSPLFGSDLEQQQQLRNVLKGKSNFGLITGVGYETKHITFDFRYNLGFNDVVETQANSYNFIENQNKNKFWQFSIGYHWVLQW